MQIESFSEVATDVAGFITSAVLRSNGQVRVQVDGKWYLPGPLPATAMQIALADSGVWCVGTSGRLYWLVGEPGEWRWVPEETIFKVRSIGCDGKGRLCAIGKDGTAYVREAVDGTRRKSSAGGSSVDATEAVQFVRSEGSTASRWVKDEDLTHWFAADSAEDNQSRVRSRRRSRRIRRITWVLIFAALASPLVLAWQRVRLQKLAVERLQAADCTIRYAFEFDADGNEIKDPQVPGPRWLRKIIGPHWFVTPERLSGDKCTDDVRSLTSLREVHFNRRNRPCSTYRLAPLGKILRRVRTDSKL